jgi:hypothetical protein
VSKEISRLLTVPAKKNKIRLKIDQPPPPPANPMQSTDAFDMKDLRPRDSEGALRSLSAHEKRDVWENCFLEDSPQRSQQKHTPDPTANGSVQQSTVFRRKSVDSASRPDRSQVPSAIMRRTGQVVMPTFTLRLGQTAAVPLYIAHNQHI